MNFNFLTILGFIVYIIGASLFSYADFKAEDKRIPPKFFSLTTIATIILIISLCLLAFSQQSKLILSIDTINVPHIFIHIIS